MIPVGTRYRRGTAAYRRGTAAILFATTAVLLLQAPGGAAAGGFHATGSMTEPSDDHTATLLEDGRVLVVGRSAVSGSSFANLYDPATGEFTPTTGQPLYVDQWSGLGRFQPAAIRLRNGKVLIVGGGNIVAPLNLPHFPPPFTVYAELYDPATDSFAQTGSMVTERFAFQPVLLPDGRVLIAGGQGCCVAIPFLGGGMMVSDSTLASAEFYDPDTGTFSLFGDPSFPYALNAPRGQVNAAALADGRILFAGGFAYEVSPTPNGAFAFYHYFASADVYDPVSQAFAPVSLMTFARAGAVAVALPNGSAYLSYQASDRVTNEGMPYAPAERFDPVSQTFSPLAEPPTYDGENRNAWGRAVTLDDGRILLAGGLFSSPAADLYDPATDTYARTQGDMLVSRFSQTATKLADGRVLYVGGDHFDPVTSELTALDSAEIYDPAYVSDPLFSDGFDTAASPRSLTGAPDHVIQSTCPDIDAPYAHFTAAHMFATPEGRLCRMVEVTRRPSAD